MTEQDHRSSNVRSAKDFWYSGKNRTHQRITYARQIDNERCLAIALSSAHQDHHVLRIAQTDERTFDRCFPQA
ncbi:hypothetical protein INH39_32840 [Massilia violaceinigra]|uniref:DUF1508 domain-containing protein n=1 Tax=Massilia violaceinigra TaxID=2045208 RepID=A0ABY4A5M6_9BURK|nr:hypothetical protein INH39_32840 [Massilia violaceinigra]